MSSHDYSTPARSSLPSSTSPSLHLIHPSPTEREATWNLNAQAWRGAFSLPAYLRREHHLASQPLTLNGGITYWILVDSSEVSNSLHNGVPNGSCPRTILASCESFRKNAIVAYKRKGAVEVEDVIVHSIGSVFCRDAFRKRGYAGRMMEELGKELEGWQQEGGKKTPFTVLYSDIGKEFYAKKGWKSFQSRHVSLPPVGGKRVVNGHANGEIEMRELFASDLRELCEADERLVRENIRRFEDGGAETRVALVPDVNTMQWHHAREEFAANETLGMSPDVKGALVNRGDGKRVWAIWTRTFGSEVKGNVLHILRMVIEGEDDFGGEAEGYTATVSGDTSGYAQKDIRAAAAVLRAAQREAATWDMATVEIWNPSPIIIAGARAILPDTKIVERDSESITSLMWYGSGTGTGNEVEWLGNEKYGWC